LEASAGGAVDLAGTVSSSCGGLPKGGGSSHEGPQRREMKELVV
jgi:hypothetical protein